MSPVPEVGQPETADKAGSSSGSDATDDGVNLQDFVVIPSQTSPSGSTSENHENEDLECYSDAQLKALLDEAITYKTPKEAEKPQESAATAVEIPKESVDPEDVEEKEPKIEEKKISGPKVEKEPVKVDTKEKEIPHRNPFISMPSTWNPSFRTIDPKSFAGPRDYGFCPRPSHTFGMPGMCCYSPAPPKAPEVVPKVEKKERNAILKLSHEIDGYRGGDNIDSLVRFIESSDSEPDYKKNGKGKPQKNGGNKKGKKAPPKPKAPTKAKEVLREVPQKTVEKLQERLPEVQQTSDEVSGKASPTIDGSEFRVVMKKKKKPKN
ncbi:uncharacterized protein LOC129787339 [Lutzomyia longipalpis]|uniref:uncharacterized protein LOC129787339 n=1 Tax=Lutzomyia longipalpis TaxID=7200 RepID=UPI002483937E|nr:uncharacterized protein LOC129787339 [Lutzomyia longipalpis]